MKTFHHCCHKPVAVVQLFPLDIKVDPWGRQFVLYLYFLFRKVETSKYLRVCSLSALIFHCRKLSDTKKKAEIATTSVLLLWIECKFMEKRIT